MRHRVVLHRFTRYGQQWIWWECACGLSGTVGPDEDHHLAAGAHVPGGAEAEMVEAKTAEELDE